VYSEEYVNGLAEQIVKYLKEVKRLRTENQRLRDGLQGILDMYPHDAEVATLDQIHWFALRTLYPVTEIPAGPVTDEELTRRAEGELREGIWDATSEGE
jgi:hypothetical protein